MADEIIKKKLEDMRVLLADMEGWLSRPSKVFEKDIAVVRAAERTFQLLVDIASDINTQLLLTRGLGTPDTYKQSFINMGKAGIISSALAMAAAEGAKVRNILVHEYDIAEDHAKFYRAAHKIMPAYKKYCASIHAYLAHQEK